MTQDPPRDIAERKEQRKELFSRAANHSPYIGVDTLDGRFVVSTADEGVGRRLFVEGRRGEMRTLDRVLEVLATHDSLSPPQESTFIDIGANIGTSCISALVRHRFVAALACEPHPANFRLLRVNAVLNGVIDRLDARCVALSDSEGTGELLVDDLNSGAHRIRRNGMDLGSQASAGEALPVPCSTLDAVWAESEPRPPVGLLWVDAQGHEAAIFEGGADLLRASPPIVFEVWPEGLAPMGGVERLLHALAPFYAELIDLRRSDSSPQPLDQLPALVDELEGAVTDVLALPRPNRRSSGSKSGTSEDDGS